MNIQDVPFDRLQEVYKVKTESLDEGEVATESYVLKSGCQWRMLPSDFPKWRTCYDYWQKWSAKEEGKPSLLEEALKKCGRRRSTRPWAGCADDFSYR